jgi:uncharacterized protein (TIGR02145 family)
MAVFKGFAGNPVLGTQATSITPATNAFITSTQNLNQHGVDWTTIDGNGSLRTAAWADGGVNDICPVGFSVPTREELEKDTVGIYPNGTGSNIIKAFNSFLKIPAAGYRHEDGIVHATNVIHMWSRSAASDSKAYYAYIKDDTKVINSNFSRILGLSVRCIKDI